MLRLCFPSNSRTGCVLLILPTGLVVVDCYLLPQVIPSARKANWPSMLPSRGLLTCTFSSSSVRRPLGVMEGSKLSTLLKQLRLNSMSDRERLELVAMFAPFALFTCKQISNIVRTFSIGAERIAAASLLFTRAADAASDLVTVTSVMSGHDLLGWREVLGWYSSYRWNVPTGQCLFVSVCV